jgi:hypothetical protein
MEWAASFDIGSKNFAFYIEQYDSEELDNMILPPETRRYNIDGTCTDEFRLSVNNIARGSRTILFKNTDISGGISYKSNLMNEELFNKMYDLLNEHKEYFDKCSVFVVEQQMKCNLRAIKLGQHCLSYFVAIYGRFRRIIEFPAYYKTQVLGIQKTAKIFKNGKTRYIAPAKPRRKKWAVEEAIRLLGVRGEEDIGVQILASTKRDDMSDCLVQFLAYKVKHKDGKI